LLFLTENYAALRILQQDLLFDAENPPFVLFGSSFPKDREYTQVCCLCCDRLDIGSCNIAMQHLAKEGYMSHFLCTVYSIGDGIHIFISSKHKSHSYNYIL